MTESEHTILCPNCLMHVRESEMIRTPSGNNCPYCEESLPDVVGDDKQE